MRADLIEALQAPVFNGLGEPWLIRPPDGPAVKARGIWIPAGSEESGSDDVELTFESDQIAFLRRDAAAVAASSQLYAEIDRFDAATGSRVVDTYTVQGQGPLVGEQHRVIVTEVDR